MSGQEGFAGGSAAREAAGRIADTVERVLDQAAEAAHRKSAEVERRVGDAIGHAAETARRGFEEVERRVNEAFDRTGASRAGDAGRGPDGATGPGPADAANEGGDRTDGERGPGLGARIAEGYSGFVEKTRSGVAGVVSRGADALDGAAGDKPWRLAGLDARDTRIAREVVREVVPKVAGERVASMLDGAAMKGGIAGAGLLMRIPLKGFAVPFMLGVGAVEAVKAVKDVRRSVADVAARVDNEARSAEAYRTGATKP